MYWAEVSKITQQTFPHCFSIVFWLILCCNAIQRQNNVEKMLYISLLEFTMMNNVNFNVEKNNIIQRWNNVVIFNGEFHNVRQCQNNVVKMTISKKSKKIKSFQIEYTFGFINVIIFVVNQCGPYSRFVGAESCLKILGGSFGSIHTNLQSITYMVCQSYFYYFCCSIVCCLYFF